MYIYAESERERLYLVCLDGLMSLQKCYNGMANKKKKS